MRHSVNTTEMTGSYKVYFRILLLLLLSIQILSTFSAVFRKVIADKLDSIQISLSVFLTTPLVTVQTRCVAKNTRRVKEG